MDGIFKDAILRACRRRGGQKGFAAHCGLDPELIDDVLASDDGYSLPPATVRKILASLVDDDFPEGWDKDRWLDAHPEQVVDLEEGSPRPGAPLPGLPGDETEQMLLHYFRSLSVVRQNKVLKCLLDQAQQQLAVNYSDLEIATRRSIASEHDESHFGFDQSLEDPGDG